MVKKSKIFREFYFTIKKYKFFCKFLFQDDYENSFEILSLVGQCGLGCWISHSYCHHQYTICKI